MRRQKSKFKAYVRYSKAKDAVQPRRPMIRVGDLFITGVDSTTCIELIDVKGRIVGTVRVRHLNRLGNANHATPAEDGFFRCPKIDWEEGES